MVNLFYNFLLVKFAFFFFLKVARSPCLINSTYEPGIVSCPVVRVIPMKRDESYDIGQHALMEKSS